MIINLKATPYTPESKGVVRRMRKQGKLPAVVYGHKEKTQTIYIEKNDFKKVLDALKKEAITVNLQVDKKEFLCIIKSIQHNPVTDELLHIDFQHIHEKEVIKATVPFHIIGEAPGVKEGGILDQRLHEVVISCMPKDLPTHIDIDISKLEAGQSLHLNDLKIPNIEFELPLETTIISVLIPRAVAAEVKPAVAEEEGEEKKEGAEIKEQGKEEAQQEVKDKEEKKT